MDFVLKNMDQDQGLKSSFISTLPSTGNLRYKYYKIFCSSLQNWRIASESLRDNFGSCKLENIRVYEHPWEYRTPNYRRQEEFKSKCRANDGSRRGYIGKRQMRRETRLSSVPQRFYYYSRILICPLIYFLRFFQKHRNQ